MTDLPKTFEPRAIEDRWYAHWESAGLFRPDDRGEATPWTIVMPPPNVTGSLHIGHALDITLQDVLTRRERMLGKDALWVVGTDHAGIATQMVVERQLEERQDKRTNYTRDEFVAKVWEWKAESGGQITQQLRRLGASCDWRHERFTMDEGFSKAVTHVFVELYKRGLAYRDKRLVNWDPKFQTAISDLEVETRDIQGKFWTLRYPLEDGPVNGVAAIEVATTRPETMLADMAVAVHPDDARYKALIGGNIRQPITGRLIPIVPDEHADPELGSGAVKITPGHDFNDFEVGKRAGFKAGDMLNMFDAQANVVQCGGIPDELLGLSREDARKRVVELLETEGALVKVEDRVIPTPYGDRSGVVIEPWLTDQWYVDAEKLVKPVLEATRKGEIRIVPETWKKTWFNWLENIQPWCVSRQLWWGHRIPAWYGHLKTNEGHKVTLSSSGGYYLSETPGVDVEVFVQETEADAIKAAEAKYGCRVVVVEEREHAIEWGKWRSHYEVGQDEACLPIWQDEDVLDTWFSSALWPFATLGWPDETEDLKRHYPNDVLISGFDILFFWDARMAMQGMQFMKAPPWKTLYLHGLVRDAQGAKMSKSKGNTVDPLGLIDKYGADALRFTLAAMESQGRDIKLDEKRVEGYRNFATKLWNAARFLQMNGVGASDSIAAPEAQLPVNRWIIGEVVETLAKLNRAFDELRYDEMADAIYHFVWGTFCDWYVELIKGAFDPNSLPLDGGGQGGGDGGKLADSSADITPPPIPPHQGEGTGADETRRVAAWAFDQILVMLHPLMPFITEELWSAMGERERDLIVSDWPMPDAQVDQYAKAEIERVITIVSDVRASRVAQNIRAQTLIEMSVLESDDYDWGILEKYRLPISRMCNLEFGKLVVSATARPVGSVGFERTNSIELFEGDASEAVVCVRLSSVALSLIGMLRSGFTDETAERETLTKKLLAAEKERDSLAARLGNPNFTERAKPEAVEKARADHEAKSAEAERLRAALARLG